jgi:DNA-binding beta-propeller fold protein YncE
MRLEFGGGTIAVLACLLCAAAFAPLARANRTLLSETALETTNCARCTTTAMPEKPPGEGQIEGPCGLAISPAGNLYLADYYHRVVDVFQMPNPAIRGKYVSQIALPGANPRFGVNTLDSVCGLAFDGEGNLYGNEWHQGAVRLTPSEATIDSGESTGIAIDPSTDRLYVDDRTYIAEYALPYVPEAKPEATFGSGSLEEGFGLAARDGRVYVADAGDQTVKVFEPAVPEPTPAATISGQFNSLTDAALAIDPTNEHLLVVDNLQPGFEHPRSAVLEFGPPAAGYPFLARLPGAPIDGGPSGIVVNASGQAIVTDGNGELSNAFLYGSYEGAPSLTPPSAAPPGFAPTETGPATAAKEGDGATRGPRQELDSASASEVSQSGGIRVRFTGSLAPRTLPRHGRRPVVAAVGADIAVVGKHAPSQLRRIEIAINRHGHFSPAAMPKCRIEEVQPATTAAALAACRRSLVGEGRFSAKIVLPQQAPFPSSGKVYAFNGTYRGHPAILAHVYGTRPLPVSYTIPFELVPQRGTYGTLLRASLPAVTGNSGYITGLSLAFGRAQARGYVSAGCPAPAGFSVARFPFARVDFDFAGGRRVGTTLVRSCRPKG